MLPCIARLAAVGLVVVAAHDVAVAAPGDPFPPVKAESLARKKIAWPADFTAKRTILLFSFGRDMQADVDAWDAALGPVRAAGARDV
jgi:hypothetical protein